MCGTQTPESDSGGSDSGNQIYAHHMNFVMGPPIILGVLVVLATANWQSRAYPGLYIQLVATSCISLPDAGLGFHSSPADSSLDP